MVAFDVPPPQAEDEEAPTNTRSAFAEKANNHKSTMTILTMDKSKSFYDKKYKKEHIGESREYWRDMILGVNGGLVSTFLLVTGVYGSGMNSTNILLTSISGLIAGAISMAAGEYVDTKTQEEVKRAEAALEAKAVREHKRMMNCVFSTICLLRLAFPRRTIKIARSSKCAVRCWDTTRITMRLT